jgi:predicted nucleic acid-binding protein
MAWCFEDEASPYADHILAQFPTQEALVPSLWPLEVANVLLVGERRKRLTAADTMRFLTLLSTLPITIDEETSYRALNQTLALAREQAISAYDAAYLELAMREGVPFATLDAKLQNAAISLGISIIKAP